LLSHEDSVMWLSTDHNKELPLCMSLVTSLLTFICQEWGTSSHVLMWVWKYWCWRNAAGSCLHMLQRNDATQSPEAYECLRKLLAVIHFSPCTEDSPRMLALKENHFIFHVRIKTLCVLACYISQIMTQELCSLFMCCALHSTHCYIAKTVIDFYPVVADSMFLLINSKLLSGRPTDLT
jgi:hypothetical protein